MKNTGNATSDTTIYVGGHAAQVTSGGYAIAIPTLNILVNDADHNRVNGYYASDGRTRNPHPPTLEQQRATYARVLHKAEVAVRQKAKARSPHRHRPRKA